MAMAASRAAIARQAQAGRVTLDARTVPANNEVAIILRALGNMAVADHPAKAGPLVANPLNQALNQNLPVIAIKTDSLTVKKLKQIFNYKKERNSASFAICAKMHIYDYIYQRFNQFGQKHDCKIIESKN
jgi:hypothetical protein